MRNTAFIHDTPAYTASEAARMLGLPLATLKAWSFGQASGGGRHFQPVIKPADKAARLLSFANLCELHVLHVLSAIRRNHRKSLSRVRESVAYLRTRLGSERPLIDRQFRTNGIDLFVEHARTLLNVSQQGQEAMRGEFESALARIEHDRKGMPVRLFPFSRNPSPGQLMS